MVRVGTLPMRLTALEYGADIVYTPELIAKKLMKCVRVENGALNTVDFVTSDGSGHGSDKNGELVLRIAAAERHAIVLQIGASDPDIALAAASLVQHDVNAVDLNMGCPKPFSVHAGMGAALTKNPDLACAILSNLVQNLAVPVTCKIRVLPSVEETIDLVTRLQSTGIIAMGVHGRTQDMRPREPALWPKIADVVSALDIPVIANGDVFEPADFDRVCAETGAASAMTARGAQWNASIFAGDGPYPVLSVAQKYLSHSITYGIAPANAKYALLAMQTSKLGFHDKLHSAQTDTHADLADLFGVKDVYDAAVERHGGSPFAAFRPNNRFLKRLRKMYRRLNKPFPDIPPLNPAPSSESGLGGESDPGVREEEGVAAGAVAGASTSQSQS